MVPGGAGQPCAVMCGRQRFVRKQLIAFFEGKSWGYVMKLASSFEAGVPFISWCSDMSLKLMVMGCCRSQGKNGFKRDTGELRGQILFSHWEWRFHIWLSQSLNR